MTASADVRRLELDLAVCASLGIPASEFFMWLADDRDHVVYHYLRRQRADPETGAMPTEWDPDSGQHP